MYEKARDAEAAEDIGAGETEDEAEDVETKELRRNGAAEAACLRGRTAADGEGRSAGSAARRESMRQAEAEIAGEGEVEAKAARSEERRVGKECQP